MNTTAADAREQRRAEFNALFDAIPGDNRARVKKVCAILGYPPGTVYVLRCKKTAWKVIPQAKLDILRRELEREAQQPAQA